MKLGAVIRGIRKAKGMTQFDLSVSSGISQVFISLVENGYKQPSLESLELISKAFEVPMYVIVLLYEYDQLDKDHQKLLANAVRELKVKYSIVDE